MLLDLGQSSAGTLLVSSHCIAPSACRCGRTSLLAYAKACWNLSAAVQGMLTKAHTWTASPWRGLTRRMQTQSCHQARMLSDVSPHIHMLLPVGCEMVLASFCASSWLFH